MDEQRAKRLLGSPERRARLSDLEVRGGTGSTFVVRGYASVVDHPYDVYGGKERGGWVETIKRGAFDVTLAAKPDVSFLINHDGMPLARTGPGTLTLRSDTTGLESEAVVDRRDPFGQALEVKLERGDMDQMSFGFRVTRQSWNEDYDERDITEVNLDHGDVSVVNTPANPATSISIVSARAAIDVLREMRVAEVRSELGDLTPDALTEAEGRIQELIRAMKPATDSAGQVEVEVVPVISAELRKLIEMLTVRDDELAEMRALLAELSAQRPATSSGDDAERAAAEAAEAAAAEAAAQQAASHPSARLLRARMAEEEYRRTRALPAA